MARPLSKTMTTTRVAYKTVEVVDGVPQFVDRPDAVFSGILEKERVERMLRGQLGKDAIIVVTNVIINSDTLNLALYTAPEWEKR